MRHPARALAVPFVASLALFAAGCNRGPAETALQEAGAALSAARPELARYAPAELALLETAVEDARSEFGKGHYTDALKAAQGLPPRIEAAVAAAAARKDEFTKAWKTASEATKPLVEGLGAKMAEIAAAPGLPRGLDPEKLARARDELGAIAAEWSRAGQAFGSGDVPGALKTAQGVRARAEALSGVLGLAAPAAAAAPSAAPAAK